MHTTCMGICAYTQCKMTYIECEACLAFGSMSSSEAYAWVRKDVAVAATNDPTAEPPDPRPPTHQRQYMYMLHGVFIQVTWCMYVYMYTHAQQRYQGPYEVAMYAMMSCMHTKTLMIN